MDIELIAGVGALGLIVAVVQLIKAAGFPSKFAGLLAVLLGLLLGLAYTFWNATPWYQAVILGLALGLAAAGAWSTGKNVAGK